jgi:hypothetical protein
MENWRVWCERTGTKVGTSDACNMVMIGGVLVVVVVMVLGGH